MKAMKKTIAVLLTVCMVVSMFALAAVTVSVGAAAGETWSVIGLKEDWNKDYDMTDNGDGTYTVAIENVASDDYEFKVRKNHNWAESYGKNGSNYEFTVAGVESTTVTITFDSDTHEITVSGEGVKKSEHNIKKIVAAGNGSQNSSFLNGESWNTDADVNKMTEIESNVYQITYRDVAAGNYQFKFAANGSWDDNWGRSGEVELNDWNDAQYGGYENDIYFTLQSEGDVTLVLDLTRFDPDTNSGAKYKIIVGDEPEPSTQPTTGQLYEEGYYIVGDFNGWQAQPQYRLTENQATQGEYTRPCVTFNSGEKFKVAYCNGYNLDAYYPDGMGNEYEIFAAGNYDVYFRPDGQGSQEYGWHEGYIYAEECSILGSSLTVGEGDISFNVYFYATNEQIDNSPVVYFNWKGADNADREIIDRLSADRITNLGGNVGYAYKAICPVPAAEMSDEITVSYSFDGDDGNFNAAKKTFSVRDNAMTYAASKNEKVKNVAVTMLNFGAACQNQFAYDTDNLANKDLGNAQDLSILTPEEIKGINANIPDKADINSTSKLSEIGLAYKGFTLFVQSKTTLRFYFEIVDA
ncbi:MAG: hypothetical protein Q3989_08495, partial [Eubacteriales bacterium]|nr:hypothetical protein [Eubacteriales bacterium]